MSTWEERMSQRAKARAVVAEAEEIARQAAEPDEPEVCQGCGGPLEENRIYTFDGSWCFHCTPGLHWDAGSGTWQPIGRTKLGET